MAKKIVKPDVKAQIIAAAEEEFLAVGYAGARMMNIAKNAGVTHAMLHYYFQSKENLFELIFKQKASGFFGNFMPILLGKQPFLEKIPRIIEAHLSFVSVNSNMPLFLIYETTKNPKLMTEALSNDINQNPVIDFYKLFEKETKKAIRNKEIRPIEPVELMLSIFSLNIFPIMAQPLVQQVGVLSEKKFRQLMKQRSRHVSDFIVKAIALNP